MRKQLSAISILGLILTLFTAGPAVTAPSSLTERKASVETASTPTFSASAANVALELRTSNLSAIVNQAEVHVYKQIDPDLPELGDEFFDYQEITDGQSSLLAEDGTYLYEVTPTGVNTPPLAKTVFTIVVTSGSPAITRSDGTAVTLVGGKYQLPLFTANVVGNLQNPNGTPVVTNYEAEIFYQVEVLRYQSGNYNGFGQFFNVDASGNFAVHIATDGEYKLRFSAFGRIDAASSLSNVFTISGGTLVTLANQRLSTPMLVVRARSATGTEDLQFVSIQIERNQEYDFAFTGPAAVTALSFASAGSYNLTINPPWGTSGNARATFTVVVTADGNGNLSAVVTGLTPQVDGSYILRFRAPTVTGRVMNPAGTEGIPFSQVVPVRSGDENPLWEFSETSDERGNYSLALPAGTYHLYAQAPYASSVFGDGPQVGPIVVSESGVATSLPSGRSATAFELRLANPTWSGRIVSPLDNSTPIADAQVCLRANEATVMTSCSQTDGTGAFALSSPANFTGFDDGTEFWVSKWGSTQFTEKRFRGKTEVEGALGTFTQGQTFSNITIALGLPNFEVLVRAAGQPASRVWVWADSDLGYIGGQETDANGIARFSIDSDDVGQRIRINTDLWNNSQLSLNFTPTQLVINPNTLVLNGGIYTTTVDLAVPNLTGLVKKPGSPAVAAGNTSVEVQNLDTGEYRWLNVGRNGVFTGNLPGPVAPATSVAYQLKVMPPWDSQEAISSTIYDVVVGPGNQVASVKLGTQDAGTETVTVGSTNVSAFVLVLSPSNILGQVVQGDGEVQVGVRDSWIEARYAGTREYLWDRSTNSRFGGNFNMNLDDGNYDLIANAPWNSSKVKSEACYVSIAGGLINKSGTRADCVDEEGQVTLKLRDGNLQINLKDPDGDAVAFGQIGVGVGNWYSWAQSDRNGRASLFIDIEEIESANPEWATAGDAENDLDIRFWFDPPWGKSGMTRWECSTEDSGLADNSICKVLQKVDVVNGFTPAAGPIDVSFPLPNTVITVTDGVEAVGVGSWVSIFKLEGSNMNWITGSQTDFSGKAYFDIDLLDTDGELDTAGTYVVEVNPPWNRGTQLSSAKHTITGGASALNNKMLALKTPNAFVTVNRADGKGPARWSWIGLEKVDRDNDYQVTSWENGASANQVGRAALSLDANSTYKLTVYPGFASAGTKTSCFISTGANAAITLVSGKCGAGVLAGSNLTIALSLGNLTGTITDATSGHAVAGVIVFAENVVTGEVVETVTDQNGKYGLQLDSGEWKVSLFHAGVTPQGHELVSKLNAFVLNDDPDDVGTFFDFDEGDTRDDDLVRKLVVEQ